MRDYTNLEIFEYIETHFQYLKEYSSKYIELKGYMKRFISYNHLADCNIIRVYRNNDKFYEFNILLEFEGKMATDFIYRIKEIKNIQIYTIDDVINKNFNKSLNKISI